MRSDVLDRTAEVEEADDLLGWSDGEHVRDLQLREAATAAAEHLA